MRTAPPAHDAVWQSADVQPLIAHVRAGLQDFGPAQGFAVGCSGGRDSLLLGVVLHHCAPDRVRWLHVDHGLHPDAGQWAAQVAGLASHWGVDLALLPVQVGGGNVEAAARQARHAALLAALHPGEVLVLGHHRQDQAETVLMRLHRGAGVAGLAAMRVLEARGKTTLWRPLLDMSRATITAAAQQLGLNWVDDPANAVTDFDRAWLRVHLWPLLQSRWPQAEAGLAQSALWMQDAEAIFAETLAQQRPQVQGGDGSLDMVALRACSPALQRLLLRDWLQGDAPRPPARAQVLILQQWLQHPLRCDAQPLLHWRSDQGHVVVRAHRQRLHRLRGPLPMAQATTAWLGVGEQVTTAVGVLTRTGPKALPNGAAVQVWLRPPWPGERVHVQGRVGRWPLKKWLQHISLPPWQRSQVLMLAVAGALDQVADAAGARSNQAVLALLTPLGLYWTAAGGASDQRHHWRWTPLDAPKPVTRSD